MARYDYNDTPWGRPYGSSANWEQYRDRAQNTVKQAQATNKHVGDFPGLPRNYNPDAKRSGPAP
jgi:hypothetical protein